MRKRLAVVFALLGIGLAAWGLHYGLQERSLVGAGLADGSSPSRLLAASYEDEDYSLSEIRYFRLAAHKVNSEYVDPTRVDPGEMLTASLDRVARLVPEFLFEQGDSSGSSADSQLRLVAGAEEGTVPVGSLDSVVELTTVIAEVAAFLDDKLSEQIERPPIEYALINGMLKTLDPHSVYIDPESYREMSIQNKGHFGGLGITIGIREERLTILYPLKDTPAWRAGLKAGDHIDKIGSESTVNMSLQEAVSMLRGPEGTDVTITVSDDEGPDREVTITRARISVPSVEWVYAGDGIGLIEVSGFAQQTYDNIEDALDELGTKAMGEGHGRLQGLILDLRQNPGGYLQQAIEVADKFLDGGVIVSTEGLAGNAREDTNARRFGTEDDLPIVVLVDEGSASASEIVAGALQNHGRAVVMGVRTFGKGSVQNLYDRDFHSGALKMTIAQYLTPGNQSIQGIGIVPDIELRPAVVRSDGEVPDVRMYWQDFELREEDLERSFTWGEDESRHGVTRWVYACNECFEPVDNDREMTPEDNLEDPEIQAAKSLLTAAPSSRSADMLRAAGPTLDKLFRARQSELQDSLGNVGIDWSLPPGNSRANRRKSSAGKSGVPAPATVTLEVESKDGVLEPGVEARVTLHVTNSGRQPLYRLRSITEGDFFGGREFFFGKLMPGETRSFSVLVKPALWLNARTEEVTWHFFVEGAVAPKSFVSRLQIADVPHPRFALAYHVVDDGSGSSVGNGDGLLQAGEEIDVLVTVRNTGDGATSDLWTASRSESAKNSLPPGDKSGASEDSAGAAEGKSESQKQNGFIRLRNRSGDAMFLTKGSDSFSVKPGEEYSTRLHFRVADDLGGRDAIEADLTVGDNKFLELLNTEVELPLFQPSDPIRPGGGFATPNSRSVAVLSGASQHSEVVAYLDGPAKLDGRLGNWLRLSLPWGVAGWVHSDEVSVSRRVRDQTVPRRHLSNSPPVIRLVESPGGGVVSSGRVTLQGEVTDDTEVRDVFVFVNQRKVLYETVSSGAQHRFSFEVDLHPGENQIEVFARDDQDHIRGLTIGVYRETATASTGSP